MQTCQGPPVPPCAVLAPRGGDGGGTADSLKVAGSSRKRKSLQGLSDDGEGAASPGVQPPPRLAPLAPEAAGASVPRAGSAGGGGGSSGNPVPCSPNMDILAMAALMAGAGAGAAAAAAPGSSAVSDGQVGVPGGTRAQGTRGQRPCLPPAPRTTRALLHMHSSRLRGAVGRSGGRAAALMRWPEPV
jgi:hypothetical protein